MSKEEAIEILKNMNDGFTFRDCSVCIEDNKYDEKDGICKSKTCEYLKSIETVLGYVRELEEEKEIYKNELKKVDKALNVKVGIAMPTSSDIIESMKRSVTQYKMIAENSIPKQVIRDKKEQITLPNIIVGGIRNRKTLEYGKKLGKIEAYDELLESEE